MEKILTKNAITKHAYWIEKICKLSGDFGDNSNKLEEELNDDIQNQGINSLIDRLRLCGDIPESYGRDSSEEKLYAKYTDFLLAATFKTIGLKTLVLKERADVADVEIFAKSYSFVADAKSFRLSRTAKNQKDFKVQAMDRWKHGKPYAMIVCPIYQLPKKSSQIYIQASSRNVCIFTYSHLAMLLSFSLFEGNAKTEELIHEIFKTISALNPSKDASFYWMAVNRTMLEFSQKIDELWKIEKQASIESIDIAKQEALKFLAEEREKIMQMSHEQALVELLKVHKIESKIKTIKSVRNNNLLEIK
ncbi:MAG: HindIII family type II restriction endonuclease [Cyanobacteria bacterium SBLK]|nr:HindIII family type II restriction endonuclease [Cyanobacteria bacterium SBLK]